MQRYGAKAFLNESSDPQWRLDRVPANWALRFDLDYPDGAKVVLIYDEVPPRNEEMALTWDLQVRAGQRGAFAVTRVESDGEATAVPGIRGRKRR